uniref:Uncharacterized protein n=1 Tax=Timema tahoe TaxID=61484 RepID=A0A7R9IFM0_9NEOP|nr:unnamed protein product [Timema tahoe]
MTVESYHFIKEIETCQSKDPGTSQQQKLTIPGPSREQELTVQGSSKKLKPTIQGPSRKQEPTILEPLCQQKLTVPGPSREQDSTTPGPSRKQGIKESKSVPSQNLQESKSLPSQDLQESKSLPSQGIKEQERTVPGPSREQELPVQGPLGKMIFLGSCVLVVVIITASVSETLPTNNADFRYIGKPVTISELRLKRTTNPTRAIMYSGYFGSPQGYHYNPPYPGNTYDPQGAMASFAEGNTVSARSYYGNEYQPSNTYPHCGNCGYQQPSNGQGYPNLAPENTGEVLPPGDVISTQQPEEQSKEKPKPTVTACILLTSETSDRWTFLAGEISRSASWWENQTGLLNVGRHAVYMCVGRVYD